ncbi:MAG: undecaprenyldiphospho-muramoylpentapeptide beta-N-acetylglucosaminyltransferase [Bacteroidetes bacterium]|nr:undecaprenyldiphospho-muramoylpentapeptide beta-N-acetylglucosaminyltransferase [Bacteroidota bacterium]MCB9226268.1 undecaprenyldiphospho-muramoylpentapeptide beta-N-acetylglucosaminyltransferase [Chitinophagales bacterium]
MSGGGSGGHVFPAIAIADAIKKEHSNAEFLFIGANGKIEMTAVPKAGYKIVGLNIAGFQRKLTLKNLLFPFKLLFSIIKAWFVVKRFKPNAAIGTGGYASGAALKVAQWQGVPTFVQEQNAFPGITNKLLAKDVKYVFAAYPGLEKYFGKDKIIISGNPLRGSINISNVNKAEAVKHFGLNENKPVVFITGGSLGASAINKAIAHYIEMIKEQDVQLIWQCGKIYEETYTKFNSESIKVLSFIDRMDYAYAAADVIISRAGGTISELALVGKPVILLPSPNVAEDHQTKNGMALVEKNAAILIKDIDANEKLVPEVLKLLANKNKQEELSKNIKLFAKPNAAKEIAQKVLATIQ